MAGEPSLIDQQDALRPFRQFINTLAGVVNDQSWSHVDGMAQTGVYQYQSIGPTGYAIEGAPIAITPGNGLQLSNGTLMLVLGAAVAYMVFK